MTGTVSLDNQIQAWLSTQSKSGVANVDYTMVDYSDGNGPKIGEWNQTTLGPQPTDEQLASVAAQAQAIVGIQAQAQYTLAIQEWLDSAAIAAGYDSIVSAVSYADDATVAIYQHQGQAFRTWRSLVWQAALTMLAQVQAGQLQPPASVEALIASLPQPNIPTS